MGSGHLGLHLFIHTLLTKLPSYRALPLRDLQSSNRFLRRLLLQLVIPVFARTRFFNQPFLFCISCLPPQAQLSEILLLFLLVCLIFIFSSRPPTLRKRSRLRSLRLFLSLDIHLIKIPLLPLDCNRFLLFRFLPLRFFLQEEDVLEELLLGSFLLGPDLLLTLDVEHVHLL